MMDALIAAGQRLADALAAENAALARLDLARAAELAAAKIKASDAFAAAYAAQAKHGGRPLAAQHGATARLAGELDTLGAENRRLLERAIGIQSRVIETIAGAAARRARAEGPYRPAGAPPARAAVQPVALSTGA